MMKPYLHTKAAEIPLHWHQKIYENLMRDVDLRVIKHVHENDEITWCHRMARWISKKNGRCIQG